MHFTSFLYTTSILPLGDLSRSRAVVARKAHNLEVVRSIRTSATKRKQTRKPSKEGFLVGFILIFVEVRIETAGTRFIPKGKSGEIPLNGDFRAKAFSEARVRLKSEIDTKEKDEYSPRTNSIHTGVTTQKKPFPCFMEAVFLSAKK